MERLPAGVSVRFQTMKLSIATKRSLGRGGRHKPTEASQWENRLPWAVDGGKCPSLPATLAKVSGVILNLMISKQAKAAPCKWGAVGEGRTSLRPTGSGHEMKRFRFNDGVRF